MKDWSRSRLVLLNQSPKGLSKTLEILVFIAVFLVTSGAQSVPVGMAETVWFLLSGYSLSELSDSAILLSNMPEWILLVNLFSNALMILLVWVFVRFIQKRNLASMGLAKSGAGKEYAKGAIIGAVLIFAAFLICLFSGALTVQKRDFSVPYLLFYFVGFLIQGAAEEILCRGYFMLSVTRKNAVWFAIVSNSVLFALLHIFNPGIGLLSLLNIALFGAFASVYVLRTENLWGACAIHSMWNFFQGNVFGIPVSGANVKTAPLVSVPNEGFDWLCGGSFGVEGGLAVTLVLTAALLLALFYPGKAEKSA